jgi:regulatory subunit for Cdc7p protein kinase
VDDAQAAKKAKCVTAATTTAGRVQDAREKERKRAEREAQKEEFRIKYTKAFPSWVFYFDTADRETEELAARVMQLNAVCEASAR